MRYYSTIAGEMRLTSSVNEVLGSIVLDRIDGLPPTFPYTVVLDVGTNAEEIVTVTSIAGFTLSVIRGEDGTNAQPHTAGAKVRHQVTARDLRESRDHEVATAAHGATGAVVGTTNTQTLINKTMSGTANTFVNVPEGAITGLTTKLALEVTNRTAADTTLTNNLSAEATARAAADTTEATTRGAADTALSGRATVLEARPQVRLVTSTTRPTQATSIVGDVIIESDTGLQRTRIGTTWVHTGGSAAFRGTHATVVTLSQGWNNIDWDAAPVNDLTMFSVASNLANIPAALAGTWAFEISATIGVNAAADNQAIGARLVVNGAQYGGWTVNHINASLAQVHTVRHAPIINLAGGVTVTGQFFSASTFGQGFTDYVCAGYLVRASDVAVAP